MEIFKTIIILDKINCLSEGLMTLYVRGSSSKRIAIYPQNAFVTWFKDGERIFWKVVNEFKLCDEMSLEILIFMY